MLGDHRLAGQGSCSLEAQECSGSSSLQRFTAPGAPGFAELLGLLCRGAAPQASALLPWGWCTSPAPQSGCNCNIMSFTTLPGKTFQRKEGKRQGCGGKERVLWCPDAACSLGRVEKRSVGLSCFCVGSGEDQRSFRCGARALGCQTTPDKAPRFPAGSRKEREKA